MNKKELKKRLTDELYKVAVEKGTEAPFSGQYLNEKSEGRYNCAVCGNQLFDSQTKFDSGTGWPSFDKAIEGAIKHEKDSSMGIRRTEVVCANCNAHLGHVFEDGPTKTKKRYCINSVCLRMEKKI